MSLLLRILKALASTLVGFILGMAFVVVLDIGGIRIKDAIGGPVTLLIHNSAEHQVSIQIRDSVLFQGPSIDSGKSSTMRLPHIGLFEVSASDSEGKVIATRRIAIDDSRRLRIEIADEGISEIH